MLTIDQIKAAHGPGEKLIHVPEWGGDVKARRLGAEQYLRLSSIITDAAAKGNAANYLAAVVEESLINENGSPMFDENSRHILLAEPIITARIGTEIMAFNKLTKGNTNG